MKKLFLLFALAFVSFGIQAQTVQKKPAMTSQTPDQKADEIVNKLKTDVGGLTDDQVSSVKEITVDRVVKNTEAFKKIGPNDKARLLAANKTILSDWETSLKTILTEDQFTKYLNSKK